MTTTTTTEYGFRTSSKTDGWAVRTHWASADGKVAPYFRQDAPGGERVDATDLDAMHAAAGRYNTAGRAFVTVVVARQRIVTVGEPEVVPAPEKSDPLLDDLAPGSIVRASKSGEPRGLFVLTADTDGIPWKGVEGPVLHVWSSPENLSGVERVHVVTA